MANKNNLQRGFTAFEAIIIVVVLLIIGFVGWKLYDNNQKKKAEDSSQVAEPPEIKNADDLETTESYLNQVDINKALNTSEIDAALNE